MAETYTQLTQEQRYQIEACRKAGLSLARTASAVGCHRSTVCRELKRNASSQGYEAGEAQRQAERRRRERAGAPGRFQGGHWLLVEAMLVADLSPEQISGRLALTAGVRVSHTWIYRFVQEREAEGAGLRRHLRRQKPYKKRGRQPAGPCIAGRRSIRERPAAVELRIRLGDWELDTMICKGHSGVIVTAVDRRSGYVLARLVPSKHAGLVALALLDMLRPFAERGQALTLTSDNGGEFAWHEFIAKRLGADFFFADAFASCQRGTSENTNGLLRQYAPKDRHFWELSAQIIDEAVKRLNNRPRKRLGYRTPTEVMLGIKPPVALGS